MRATGVGNNHMDAKVINGGVISNRKGVNLPGTVLDLSPLTEKDRADLAFGLALGVDWVALSFVQKPRDMIEARGLIGNRARLMAKIEKPSALDHIDDIIRLSDAIMVARGDLGVEIPHEDVPVAKRNSSAPLGLRQNPWLSRHRCLNRWSQPPRRHEQKHRT